MKPFASEAILREEAAKRILFCSFGGMGQSAKPHKDYLPVDAVVMAGGQGTRLAPLTINTPKSLLPVNGRPILAYTLRHLQKHGIKHISIAVHHLKEQIERYVAQLPNTGATITCVAEDRPRGTIGALARISGPHRHVLLTNSDAITDIDCADFFRHFVESEADMMVAAAAYTTQVPYAVLETERDRVVAFEEKPKYTHHVNTGMYLLKRSLVSLIPIDRPYNATDLMSRLIAEGKKLSYYATDAYWLDIGQPDDYRRAQKAVRHLKL